MSNHVRYQQRPLLTNYANQVTALELLWPLPLIGLGLFEVKNLAWIGLALGLALLPWLARWLAWGRPTRPAVIGGALALLGLSSLVGIWASYDVTLSLPLLCTLLGSISLFFAIINTHLSPRRIAAGVIVVATLGAFYFVSQYGYFGYSDEVGRFGSLGRLTGSLLPRFAFFLPQPNAAAGFFESSLLLCFVLARQSRGGVRIGWAAAAGLLAYGILISGSRGAWVGLMGAAILWLLLQMPTHKARLAVGGGLLIAIVLGIYILFQLVLAGSQIPGLTSTIRTAISRLTLYRNSLYLLGDYPFTGIGLGDTFAMVYSRYQLLIQVPFLTYSHNLFLSVGLGLGILGLVALGWLLIRFYIFIVQVETMGLVEQDLPLFRAAWLGATITFVHGLTDAPQFSGSGFTLPLLLGVLGIAVVLGRLAFDQAEKPRTVSPAFYQRGGWVLAVGLVVIGGIIFWQPLLSAWYANLGALQQTRAELSPDWSDSAREAAALAAISDFSSALAVSPTQPVANRRLGLMALEREKFEPAIQYLEQAYLRQPGNQATLKALGYAYLWSGQLDRAELPLRRLDDRGKLIEDLRAWSFWWASQNRPALTESTDEMIDRLLAMP